MHKQTAMQFRTQIPISKSDHPIGYDSEVVSLGSCFAEHMAAKFEYFQFRQTVNPFGILFHPKAIARLVGFAESNEVFSEADVFFHNGRWHCFDAHSDLSDASQLRLIDNLNYAVGRLRQKLQQATHIIITYGTAWVYRDIVSQNEVANCHKLPQSHFSKELLSVQAITQSIENTVAAIKGCNPGAEIIFTISPVRHLKDGFVENQRSKANLVSALHGVLENQPGSYFPSYEIVMDELRDYRFYAEDMVHPNTVAIDYIWQRFAETHIAAPAFAVMEKVAGIRKSLAHRPFDPGSASHKQFLLKLQAAIDALKQQYPHMDF